MLLENLYLVPLFIILCTIQSILGIGVLVIGTPVLLIFNFEIIEVMLLLLPISIITSSFNLLINKVKLSNTNFVEEKKITFNFFTICLPFVFLGLIFLNNYKSLINFDILVGAIILFSTLTKRIKKTEYVLSKNKNKLIISLIGFVHGLTNSGGTLMTIFILNKNKGDKKNSINQIHYFYFLLASVQFLILIILTNYTFLLNRFDFLTIFLVIFFTSIIGNKINRSLGNRFFSNLIDVMALIACFVLISKIFFSA